MKNRWLIAWLAVTPVVLSFVGTARGDVSASALFAGTAKVEITPAANSAIDLLGRALSPRDPLFARVLVLKSGDVSLAIVSVDAIVFASPKVVSVAKAQFGITHVILSATHTHAGTVPRGLIIRPPASLDWTRSGTAPGDLIDWPALSSDPWYAATEAKIIAAIGQAMQNRFAARVVAGKGPLESAYMAHNRRLVRPGVPVVALWENPERRPTTPVDPTVGVVRIDDLAGKPRALAVHYACHPVATMGAGVVSRDFPGAMVDYVEQELGPDCLAMYLQGAQGDLDPYDLHNLRGENRFNIVRQAGISLGKGALRVAADLKTEAAAGAPDNSAGALHVKESLLTIPNRSGSRTTDVGLSTVVIGRKLALVAIPGEPFIQHQLDLAAKSPVADTFVLGLAYCGQGTPFAVYIPTVQAVKEGGYGATECSFLAADAGENLIAEALARIRDLLADSQAP
jgi:neutral ceramidase